MEKGFTGASSAVWAVKGFCSFDPKQVVVEWDVSGPQLYEHAGLISAQLTGDV